MKRLIGTILLIVWLPLLAAAQGSDYSRGHGYFYGAPGVRIGFDEPSAATIQIGGGGEAFFIRNLGLGVDLAGVRVSGPYYRDWHRVFSPNLVVRFRANRDEDKLEPYVTAGGAFFSGPNYEPGLNVGSGFNYWFHDHVGLRFEVRDSFEIQAEPAHFVGFRIGLTFR